jgi:hypothetical protein
LEMMKAAFAVWDNRIAPVFDVVRKIHLVEAEAGKVIHEMEQSLGGDLPVQKVFRLSELGVGTLVCGAISRPLHVMVAASGIEVIPFISGELKDIVLAWLTGRLDGDAFVMPGCCGRGRRRFVKMRGLCKEEIVPQESLRRKEYIMPRGDGTGPTGMGQGSGGGRGRGQGGGRGKGQGPQSAGRIGGGASASGAGEVCVCPQCGKKEPHQRGVPCYERKCPACGANMIREGMGNT